MKATLKNMLTPTYLLIWLVLSLYIGIDHEAFSDEAQSFLIARDATSSEILAQISRTEGTPSLWHFWLKLCIFMGLDYESLYLTSIIPNFIGVVLFVYFAPFPKPIKYLFPMTFYIFYQYNVIARNYSFLLLFITLSAIFYRTRKTHPYRYIISLMFLGSITAYSFILSGGLCFLYLVEQIREKQKFLPQLILFALFGLATTWSLFPEGENQYLQDNLENKGILIFNTVYLLSQGFISSYFIGHAPLIGTVFGLCFFLFLLIYLLMEYPLPTCVLFLPVQLIMFFVPYHPWHSGILILIIMLILWQYQPRNKVKKIYFQTALILFFIHQLIGTIFVMNMDKKQPYSGGKAAAEYILAQKWNPREVYIPIYNSLSLKPYFADKTFSYWDWRYNGFLDKEKMYKLAYSDKFIITMDVYLAYQKDFDELQRQGNYKIRKFTGGMFFPIMSSLAEETQILYYRGEDDKD